jgi:hypothetical protein
LVCKGIQEKAEEVNSTKAYVTNDETSGWILNGRYTNSPMNGKNLW